MDTASQAPLPRPRLSKSRPKPQLKGKAFTEQRWLPPGPGSLAPSAVGHTQQKQPVRTAFTATQLKIIRTTVAKDLTPSEFDHFMETAQRTGLDPLRRQIVPLLLARSDPERRSLSPIATIDGLRAIAARAGDYRPMETPPRLLTKKTATDPDTNPLGIVRAEALVWKFDGDEWRPVAGEAWWDEYAPLRPAPGDPDRLVLAEPWRRMGRVMIAKCAEAQALRRGWPEDLAGLYGQEELARSQCEELTASARVAHLEATEGAAALAGSKAILLALTLEGPLERVMIHEAKERLSEGYARLCTLEELVAFDSRNRTGLRDLWTLAPADALAVKQAAEHRRAELSSGDAT